MTLPLGADAPDFTLRDQHGAPVALSALQGSPVVLVFFPFAFSGVCTGELQALREQQPVLRAAGARLLAISCDPVFALRRFADEEALGFPLLSDFWPHGEVARAYGVLVEEHGCPARSSYVLDRSGVVRWSVHNPMGQARDAGEYVAQVTALRVPEDSAK
ncbi:MAG: peroxiredoxin [Brachybacterium paraconglomeratum]|nr:peroxiredoxin [Brachybacterium paraconglomeratum]